MKKQNGITLIALVITIIVLLILAGVSISMISGDDGIATQAAIAKDKSRAGDINEQIGLAVSNNKLNKYADGGKTTKEDLIETLKKEGTLTDTELETLKTSDTIEIGGVIVDFSPLVVKVEEGAFIKYNVSYTDAYYGYSYSSTNGWRYLGKNTEGKHMIISTGIPAQFNYVYGNTAQSWWDADETLNQNVRVANGLKNNLVNVPLLGYGNVECNASMFLTDIADKVTISEYTNGTSGAQIPSNWNGLVDNKLGLYNLNDLSEVNGLSSYVYTDYTYFLGTPSGNSDVIWGITANGSLFRTNGAQAGIRPIIVLDESVDITSLVIE